MNISGIRPAAGFYDYNSIKNVELRSQQIQQAKQAENDSLSAQGTEEQNGAASSAFADGRALEQNFGAYDYAQLYQPDATYEMKGEDSDIRSLDMEQAISDMQKDQVLQQYQFFVGEKADTVVSSALSVRDMENFSI